MESILSKINQEIGSCFDTLCGAIDANTALTPKVRELIRLACVTMERSDFGIRLHTFEAKKAGAAKEEIIAAVINCLPVSGIEKVSSALAAVMRTLEDI